MSKVNKIPEDMAKKIWLAGLGVYGLTNAKTKEKMTESEEKLSKEFEDLVSKGQKIENEMFGKVKEVEEKVKERLNKSIEEKKTFVKNVFGLKEDDKSKQIETLTAKVETLTEAIEKLSKK
jgi:adenine-specific DNA methylase